MKLGHLFLFAALSVAAVAVASGSPSRKLNVFAVTSNLDPLDTYDAFTDASGRTFVRVVESPGLEDEDEEGTVFGEIFKSIATALTGGVIGGGEILEVVVENAKEGGEEGGSAHGGSAHGGSAEGGSAHGGAAEGGSAHGGAAHAGEKRRM